MKTKIEKEIEREIEELINDGTNWSIWSERWNIISCKKDKRLVLEAKLEGYRLAKEELKREELEFLDSLTKRKTMSQGTLEIIFERIKQLEENLEK